MSTSVDKEVDLLGQLGYQEVPEKVWVWAVPMGGCLAEDYGHKVFTVACSTAKEITLYARRFPYNISIQTGVRISSGWPEVRTLPEAMQGNCIRDGVMLIDEVGKELRRWEVDAIGR